jgi:hypothetical protein
MRTSSDSYILELVKKCWISGSVCGKKEPSKRNVLTEEKDIQALEFEE